MIVTCEACGTSYKVKSSQISTSGSKVRCSKCQHVFIAYSPIQEPEPEKFLKDKTKTGLSEADYSNISTSTFLADAAETEKQLDAFFAEDFESETESDTETKSFDSGFDGAQMHENESDALDDDKESLFDTTREAMTDFSGAHDPAAEQQQDSFEFDFADSFSDDSKQIFMQDLEYDQELSFSDLEIEADMDISELEAKTGEDSGHAYLEGDTDFSEFGQEADFDISDLETESAELDISDLEPEAGVDVSEPEEYSDIDLSDLELKADRDMPELEAEADLYISELEFDDASMIPAPEDSNDDLAFNTVQETFDIDLNASFESDKEQAFHDSDKAVFGFPDSKADMEVPDLEAEADLDISDLEIETADLDISDLESETGVDLSEAEAIADVELSDLSTEAEVPDLEAEADLDISDLETETADLDISDLESETGVDVSEAGAIADVELSDLSTEAEMPDLEAEAELDISDLETETADLDISDLESETDYVPAYEKQSKEALFSGTLQETFDLDLSASFESDQEHREVSEDLPGDVSGFSDTDESVSEISDVLPEDEEEVSFETVHEEFDLDLDPFDEPDQEHKEIPEDLPGDVSGLSDTDESVSDTDESVSEIPDALPEDEEEVSFETVHEEFDLDLDTFELNLEDEEGSEDGSFNKQYGAHKEVSGKKKIEADMAEMDKDEKKPGKTEDLFELDIDFDFEENRKDQASETFEEDELDFDLDFDFEESEEAAFGPQKPQAEQTGVAGEDKDDQGQEEVYEVNLELGRDDEDSQDDDFLLNLDLDFDETPEEAAPAGKTEDKSKEGISPDLDTSLDASAAVLRKEDYGQEDLELDLELEQKDSEGSAEEFAMEVDQEEPADKAAMDPMDGVGEDRGLDSSFDLESEEDSESFSAEDDDFELNLETMFEEDEEAEDSKDVLFEAVDDVSDQMESRQEKQVEARETGPYDEDEPVVFAGVTDDTEESEETRIENGIFEDDSKTFEKAFPPKPRRGSKKRIWSVLAIILVLAALGAGAYMYFYGMGDRAPVVADPGNLKIAVSDPSYRFIENQHTGELLVVTGSVTNRYDHARKNILVESGLHDDQGRLLARASAICGNTLLAEQLQGVEVERLLENLDRRAGNQHQIPVVQPGSSLPFMMIFSNPPEGIAELSVKSLSSEKVDLN